MEYALTYMLSLLGCACRGSIPTPPLENVDWSVILSYAMKHHSTALVYSSVNKLTSYGYSGVPNTVFTQWRKMSLENTYTSFAKKMAMLEVLRKIEADSIPFVILKGDSLAWRYNSPDDRLSIDTDILIPPEYEERILQLMVDLGATVETRVDRFLHSRCFLPQAGLIEIHVDLVDDVFSDTVFNRYNEVSYDALEKGVFPAADGGVLTCLAGKDEFIFVFNHFVKHFISAGCNLRNITDILVLMAAYNDSLDWNYVMEYAYGLKMDVLLSCVAVLGVTRFGYAQVELPKLRECSPLLADNVITNIARSDNKKGEISSQRVFSYMRKRYQEQGNSSFALYLIKWKLPRTLRRFFPTIKDVYLQYPFTRKTFLFLPVAYAFNIYNNIWHFFKKKQFSSMLYFGDDNSIDQASDERIDLFKKLDML